jgi:hypothetical protein
MINTVAYIINDKKAVSETLNGETIIINLENGNYYSLNETGSVVWGGIKSSHSLEHIIEYFTEYYIADKSEIEASVKKLIEFLVGENLIQETKTITSVAIAKGADGEKRPFIVPEAKRYEDLQEILLADPIHDVDDLGWPILKEKV